MKSEELLVVRDLRISGAHDAIVNGVTFSLARGTALTLAGESGSGKSLVGQAATGTLPDRFKRGGCVTFDGVSMLVRGAGRPLWGRRVLMIPQEPLSVLDPNLTVEAQVADVLRYTRNHARPQARDMARQALSSLGMDSAVARLRPHTLSGGMRQRVLTAIALVSSAEFIVFDEPTKGLDTPLCEQVGEMIRALLDQGRTLLCITHDFTLPRILGGRLAIMRQGRIVEFGDVDQVFNTPQHPYTKELLASLPENGLHIPKYDEPE